MAVGVGVPVAVGVGVLTVFRAERVPRGAGLETNSSRFEYPVCLGWGSAAFAFGAEAGSWLRAGSERVGEEETLRSDFLIEVMAKGFSTMTYEMFLPVRANPYLSQVWDTPLLGSRWVTMVPGILDEMFGPPALWSTLTVDRGGDMGRSDRLRPESRYGWKRSAPSFMFRGTTLG